MYYHRTTKSEDSDVQIGHSYKHDYNPYFWFGLKLIYFHYINVPIVRFNHHTDMLIEMKWPTQVQILLLMVMTNNNIYCYML